MNLNKFKNIKLLYVEDEEDIRKYAMKYFNRIFDNTYEASSVNEAFKIFKEKRPQIVITDIKMQELSGIELLKKIRQIDENCQLIILSAFLDTQYLLDAIELNLVKYLTKPIDDEEMYSVLEQCANKILRNSETKFFFNQDCYFDLDKKELLNENNLIKLAKNEAELLDILCSNESRTISYQEIQNRIWYDSFMSDNALRVLVKRLRKKLPKDILENIPKIGYKIRCF